MIMGLKIAVGLSGLLLLVMGLNVMFNPVGAAPQFAVEALGNAGLNTLRGDMGGMFLASAVMLGLGIFGGRPQFLLAAALVMGLIAFGRLVGFVMDGSEGQPYPAFIVEIVFVALFVYTNKRLTAEST